MTQMRYWMFFLIYGDHWFIYWKDVICCPSILYDQNTIVYRNLWKGSLPKHWVLYCLQFVTSTSCFIGIGNRKNGTLENMSFAKYRQYSSNRSGCLVCWAIPQIMWQLPHNGHNHMPLHGMSSPWLNVLPNNTVKQERLQESNRSIKSIKSTHTQRLILGEHRRWW